MASSDNYKAWDIDEKNFPFDGTLEDKINFLVCYGVLAPSTHNTQPWAFEILEDNLLISVNEKKRLRYADPNGYMALVSLGGCLMNIEVAANNFGMSAKHSVSQHQGTPTIRVLFTDGPTPFASLFPGITKRRSNKTPFLARKVSKDVIDKVNGLQSGKARVTMTSDERAIGKLAELHKQSTMEFSKSPKFAHEVGSWMRLNKTAKYDGMPGFTFGLSNGMAVFAKMMTMLTPKSVVVVAKNDYKSMMTASMAGLIQIAESSPEGYVDAGRVFELAGLELAMRDILLAPKAAIIQSGHGKELSGIFQGSGNPVLYFVAGSVSNLPSHSPRTIRNLITKEANR